MKISPTPDEVFAEAAVRGGLCPAIAVEVLPGVPLKVSFNTEAITAEDVGGAIVFTNDTTVSEPIIIKPQGG